MNKSLQILSLLIFFVIKGGTLYAQKGQIFVFQSEAEGFHTKTVFYDDGKEVIAFDAQFTEDIAREALDFLKNKTTNPVKYLVITHPNPDKFNGIPVFKNAGAKVVMSKATAANIPAIHAYKKYYFVEMAHMFTEDNYPKEPQGDIIFDQTYSLKLANGGQVALTELNQSGISTNQTIGFIKDQNALIVGDLVHHKAHAWLEGPIVNGTATYNTANWVMTLESIQSQFDGKTLVYGGRGDAGTVATVIPEQINYLKKAERLTTDYLASIKNDKSAVDYSKLQVLFEENFSGYSLGYMVAYGAYGLVNSLD